MRANDRFLTSSRNVDAIRCSFLLHGKAGRMRGSTCQSENQETLLPESLAILLPMILLKFETPFLRRVLWPTV